MADRLQLCVRDVAVDVLTGIYSEETKRPQPLRISVTVDLAVLPHFEPETPLSQSKNYLDLHAAITGLAKVHFTLIEAVADRIAATLLDGDARVLRVEVAIDKLAIAAPGEAIGIRMVRERPA